MDTDSELQNNVGATAERRSDTGENKNLIYDRRRWGTHQVIHVQKKIKGWGGKCERGVGTVWQAGQKEERWMEEQVDRGRIISSASQLIHLVYFYLYYFSSF